MTNASMAGERGKTKRNKTDRRKGRADIEQQMGGDNLEEEHQKEVHNKFNQYIHNKFNYYEIALGQVNHAVNMVTIAGNTSPRTQKAAIVGAAATLGFKSASSGAYHILKHKEELPTDHRTGKSANQMVKDFVTSARDTITNGRWRFDFRQSNKEVALYFYNNRMVAIVTVGENGNTFISTYMRGYR